jgi:hypothetical protein
VESRSWLVAVDKRYRVRSLKIKKGSSSKGQKVQALKKESESLKSSRTVMRFGVVPQLAGSAKGCPFIAYCPKDGSFVW